MRIIEIAALDNGAHRNQNGCVSVLPDGWAIIPPGMMLENFPFGDITTEDVDGVAVVTSWVPGTIPEPEPVIEHPGQAIGERIATLEYENTFLKQQVIALSDQNDFQEELIVELANIVYA